MFGVVAGVDVRFLTKIVRASSPPFKHSGAVNLFPNSLFLCLVQK